MGYNAPEYAVTVHALNSFNTFTASYYHRVSRDTEAGAKALYDTKATHGGVALEVGTKTYAPYFGSLSSEVLIIHFSYIDNSAFVKAKINNLGVLALGYSQSLRPGVRASFGLALDTQKLNEVSPSGSIHKV
jgi:voltage-dependent anion channel protein 2